MLEVLSSLLLLRLLLLLLISLLSWLFCLFIFFFLFHILFFSLFHLLFYLLLWLFSWWRLIVLILVVFFLDLLSCLRHWLSYSTFLLHNRLLSGFCSRFRRRGFIRLFFLAFLFYCWLLHWLLGFGSNFLDLGRLLSWLLSRFWWGDLIRLLLFTLFLNGRLLDHCLRFSDWSLWLLNWFLSWLLSCFRRRSIIRFFFITLFYLLLCSLPRNWLLRRLGDNWFRLLLLSHLLSWLLGGFRRLRLV